MNKRERYKIKYLDTPPTNVLDTEALRYFQRTVTQALYIKELEFQLGAAQSYIAELEDAEKKEVRYSIKLEEEFDRLRKHIKTLLDERGELRKAVEKAEAKVNQMRREAGQFIKPINV